MSTTPPAMGRNDISSRLELHDSDAGQCGLVVEDGEYTTLHPRILFESTPAILHSISPDGKLVHVSDLWLAKTGYTRQEVIGRAVTDFMSPVSREVSARATIPELFRVGRVWDLERQIVCKSGETVDVLISAIAVRDPQGGLMSVSVLQDVTQHNRARDALVAEHERLRVTLDSIGEGVIVLDHDGNVEHLNPIAEKLTGWLSVEAKGLTAGEVFRVIGSDTRKATSTSSGFDATRRSFDISDSGKMVARSGQEYYIERSSAPIKDASGATTGAVLVFRDISERVRLQNEMLHRATHDALTGTLNRDEFERLLDAAMRDAQEYEEQYAILYIDLDRLKLVNDAAGHSAGDRLIKQAVGIIEQFVEEGEAFARLGGDEFGILLDRRRANVAKYVAQQICRALDTFRFSEGNLHLHIGASIGLVRFDRGWTTAASVLQAADSACYAAKAAGRNRVHVYTTSDEAIASHRNDMHWARRLEEALDNGQFTLFWQRIVALDGDRAALHGEVLLRMVDSDGKLIIPGRFLPSAERFQMIERIDRWVVREVFGFLAKHKHRCGRLATVSVNLSGQSISNSDFHLYVIELMEILDFDTKKVCFEVTETAVITNFNDARVFFSAMRARGVRFALDDFGSGVSSFGYLKELPVDYLKIDGQFIKGLADDPIDQAMVRCINEIARATGKRTIAEFVETKEVEEILRRIGIDYAQGFLHHRPAPIVEMFKEAHAGAGENDDFDWSEC